MKKQKAKDFKIIQDKLKKAEKYIQVLTQKEELETYEKEIQNTVETTNEQIETGLKLKDIHKLESEIPKLKREISKLEKENEGLLIKKEELENEIKKLSLHGVHSHPDSGRKLSPKYKNGILTERSAELEDVSIHIIFIE